MTFNPFTCLQKLHSFHFDLQNIKPKMSKVLKIMYTFSINPWLFCVTNFTTLSTHHAQL